MRSYLIANWKNSPASEREALEIIKGLKRVNVYRRLHTFVAPPFVYFGSVAKGIKGAASLASQNIFPGTGVHTGEVTIDILKSFGVKLAIIGHSERRALGETDKDVSKKIKTVLAAGIIPLVCVGEKDRDPDGEHFEFLRLQLRHSLEGVSKENSKKLIVAYEPVWAIGAKAKGAVKPKDLSQSVIYIRKILNDLFGREVADKIPVLYGGSVDASNCVELSETGIRGFLVGRASLEPKSFKAIAECLI
ncbi:MAG: triose-phosphate isomerase [bacterium]|nr:triose-phosphate isomerase [bacterium]